MNTPSSQPVVLTQRGVLHVWYSPEACNLDDAAAHTIYLNGEGEALNDSHYRRRCRRCFKRKETP
jgi:hypothetical protein